MFDFFSKSTTSPHPYRIGLALSGGGAKGAAHIGVLRALGDIGIKPDIITGVSAGAIAASYYAAGVSPDEMFQLCSKIKIKELLKVTMPTHGLFKLSGLYEFLDSTLPVKNIEELKIPTIIGAANLDTFKFVEFTSGNIAERLVASCSIPVVVQPAEINGEHYVDGGVLHNLPATCIRNKCDVLIGVNVSPLAKTAYKHNMASIAYKSYRLMATNNAKPDIELCDVIIPLDEVAQTKTFDTSNIQDIAKEGYFKAMKIFTNSEIIQSIINETNR